MRYAFYDAACNHPKSDFGVAGSQRIEDEDEDEARAPGRNSD